jgi:hypothetical protein
VTELDVADSLAVVETWLASSQTSLHEVVVQHQRGLARGGRTFERCRGDTDDYPSAAERIQHVAAGEGTVDGVEVTAGLD